MSIHVMSKIMRDRTYDGKQKLILLAIADMVDRDGVGFASYRMIKEVTDVSDVYLRECINRFVADGRLAILSKGRGRGQATVYRVITDLCNSLPENSVIDNSVLENSDPPISVTPDEISVTPPSNPPSYTSVLFTPVLMEPPVEQAVAKKPKVKKETTPEQTELNRRINDLAKEYANRVPLCNFTAIMGIVRKAVRAGYTDDQITTGLVSLADENRPVTTDTLRIAMDGFTPFTRSKGQQSVDEYERMLAHYSAMDAAEMKAVEA